MTLTSHQLDRDSMIDLLSKLGVTTSIVHAAELSKNKQGTFGAFTVRHQNTDNGTLYTLTINFEA